MLNGRWFAGRMVLVEYLAPKVRKPLHEHVESPAVYQHVEKTAYDRAETAALTNVWNPRRLLYTSV